MATAKASKDPSSIESTTEDSLCSFCNSSIIYMSHDLGGLAHRGNNQTFVRARNTPS
jgi:hypothetical protein